MERFKAIRLVQENLEEVVAYLETLESTLGPKLEDRHYNPFEVGVDLIGTAMKNSIDYVLRVYLDFNGLGRISSRQVSEFVENVEPSYKGRVTLVSLGVPYSEDAFLSLDLLKDMKKARGETENKRVYGLEAQIVETIKERITTQMEGWERGETESGVYYIYTIPGKSGEILVHLLPPKVSSSDEYQIFVYHKPKEGKDHDLNLNLGLNLGKLYQEVKRYSEEKTKSGKDGAREKELQPLAKILGITFGTAI